MRPLEQLQKDFMVMLAGSSSMALGPSRVSAEQSQAIYRRNYRENHVQALADTYEHVATLVGMDYFHQLARRYLAIHPSRSGDLNDYGEHFADFLQELLPQAPGGEAIPYLPDMARLDWAWLRALRAPNGNTVALTTLASWPLEQQGEARMRLQPACTLLRSSYPLHALWRLASGEDLTVNLGMGGETVLVSRPGGQVQLHSLESATAFLIQHWMQGNTLAVSLAAVATHHPGADLGALFATINGLAVVGELWRNT